MGGTGRRLFSFSEFQALSALNNVFLLASGWLVSLIG